MPRQEADEPFADEERLFRRLRADWVEDGRVQPDAIELPKTSTDRELFASDPRATLERGTRFETGVAAIRFGDVPDEFRYEASPVVYECVVVHCPEGGNAAHSEIRIRPVGEVEPRKPNSAAFKARIRDELASRMRVVVAPTALDDEL